MISKNNSNLPVLKLPPFYLMIVFWGEEFRNMFLEYTVASLLSPNNIAAIKDRKSVRFLICTSKKDWDALQVAPIFQKMAELIEPVFLNVRPDRYFYSKYHQMAFGHKRLTEVAFESKAIGINLNPDTVLPDGCLAEAQRLAEAGKNLVLAQAVRFEMEGVMGDVDKLGLRDPISGIINIPMRTATLIGIRNFHKETKGGNWDSPYFGALNSQHLVDHFPICCYWEVPDEDGVVMFGHNWAPFIINYASIDKHHSDTFENWTIDGVYAFQNFAGQELGRQVHIIQDSDSLFLLGMTPRAEMEPVHDHYWWKGNSRIAQWCKGYLLNRVLYVGWMDDFRREIYPTYARWHGRELNENWDAVERHGSQIVRQYATKDLSPDALLGRITTRADLWRFFRSGDVLRFIVWKILFRKGVHNKKLPKGIFRKLNDYILTFHSRR